MSQLTPTDFIAKWLARFADNNIGAITEGDLREFAQDLNDSALVGKLGKSTQLGSSTDLNTATTQGLYILFNNTSVAGLNYPVMSDGVFSGTLLVIGDTNYSDAVTQILTKAANPVRQWVRSLNHSGVVGTEAFWEAWVETTSTDGHTQNTDTGTTQTAFQLGQGASGASRSVEAVGTAADIDLSLTPKGAGNIKSSKWIGTGTRLAHIDASGNLIPGVATSTLVTTADLGTVLIVSKNGNNATAMKGRLDKPYATWQAAVDAAVSGDFIWGMGGDYSTQNINVSTAKALNFDIRGCKIGTIEGVTGSTINITGDKGSEIAGIAQRASMQVFNVGKIASLFQWSSSALWEFSFCHFERVSGNLVDIRGAGVNLNYCTVKNPAGAGFSTGSGKIKGCNIVTSGYCVSSTYTLTDTYLESTGAAAITEGYALLTLSNCLIKTFTPLALVGGSTQNSKLWLYNTHIHCTDAAATNSLRLKFYQDNPASYGVSYFAVNNRFNKAVDKTAIKDTVESGNVESDFLTL